MWLLASGCHRTNVWWVSEWGGFQHRWHDHAEWGSLVSLLSSKASTCCPLPCWWGHLESAGAIGLVSVLVIYVLRRMLSLFSITLSRPMTVRTDSIESKYITAKMKLTSFLLPSRKFFCRRVWNHVSEVGCWPQSLSRLTHRENCQLIVINIKPGSYGLKLLQSWRNSKPGSWLCLVTKSEQNSPLVVRLMAWVLWMAGLAFPEPPLLSLKHNCLEIKTWVSEA